MSSIVLCNFEEKFKALETSLKSAVLVAIDTEFSGLRSASENPSLFDSNGVRYTKLKDHIGNYVIIQFGLAAFHYDDITNSYSADVFNVYLFPRLVGTPDVNIKFQSTSVQFLCRYDFDFNKMAYEGLSYVTMVKEAQLKADLAAGVLLHKLHNLCEVDTQDVLKAICSSVGKWLATAKEGDKLIVNCPDKIHLFLVHHSLRISFPTIWTEKLTDSNENDLKDNSLRIQVTKVSALRRTELQSAPGGKWYEEEALLYMQGFSRIFSILASLPVPIIGHNVLLDFMMSFQQFIAPLPDTYEQFKTKLHQIFPKVYDTKFISLEIKKDIEHDDLWDSSLQGVYTFMNSKRCDDLFPDPPQINTEDYEMYPNKTDVQAVKTKPEDSGPAVSADGDAPVVREVTPVNKSNNAGHFHEAGWDAFCSGFVFVRLAYIKACLLHQDKLKRQNVQGEEMKPPQFYCKDLLQAVEKYENRVHITMGQISHIHLGGDDVKTCRPPLVHLQSRTSAPLDIPADMLARCGSVDIKSYTHYKALLAAPNVGCVRDILRTFKKDPAVKVELYSVFHHSSVIRSLLWVGATACTIGGSALCIYACRK